MPFNIPCLKHHLHATRPPLDTAAEGNHIAFHYGRERGVVLEDVDEAQFLLLSLLDGKHTFEEIVCQLQARDAAITAKDVAETLEELTRYGLVEDAGVAPPLELTASDLERYESQIRFFSVLDASGTQRFEMQAKLKRARVTVLGLGGLGSNVLMGLAAIGVGYIRGVDFDNVELSNLNRQALYDVLDIGRPKVEAAQEQLRRFEPEVRFEGVESRIESPDHIIELMKDTDLAVLCADMPAEIDTWMNEAAIRSGMPYTRGGYRGAVAEVGPFVLPFQTSCMRCLPSREGYVDSIAELAWITERHWLRHPNIFFVTAMAANLICSEICKYITGLATPATYNNMYALDIERFTLTARPCERNEQCELCGEKRQIQAPIPLAHVAQAE